MGYYSALRSFEVGSWIEVFSDGFLFKGQIVSLDFTNQRDGQFVIKDMDKNEVIFPINETNRFIVRRLKYLPEDVSAYVAKNAEKKNVLVSPLAGKSSKEAVNENGHDDGSMPTARLAKLQGRAVGRKK